MGILGFKIMRDLFCEFLNIKNNFFKKIGQIYVSNPIQKIVKTD